MFFFWGEALDGPHIADKVQIKSEEIMFPGPDYRGNYPEEHKCLPAGISAVDNEHTVGFMGKLLHSERNS